MILTLFTDDNSHHFSDVTDVSKSVHWTFTDVTEQSTEHCKKYLKKNGLESFYVWMVQKRGKESWGARVLN